MPSCFCWTAPLASPGLEEGSILRLTGIASSQVNPKALFLVIVQDPEFRLIIRSPQDIKILKTGSWWNFRHTAVVLATLLTAVLASFVWVNMLRKRVLRQAAELKRATEKAKAVHDLTECHAGCDTPKRLYR